MGPAEISVRVAWNRCRISLEGQWALRHRLSSHSSPDPAGPGLRSDNLGRHRSGLRQDASGRELKECEGFHRDHPPDATTISRTLAGVPYEQLLVGPCTA